MVAIINLCEWPNARIDITITGILINMNRRAGGKSMPPSFCLYGLSLLQTIQEHHIPL